MIHSRTMTLFLVFLSLLFTEAASGDRVGRFPRRWLRWRWRRPVTPAPVTYDNWARGPRVKQGNQLGNAHQVTVPVPVAQEKEWMKEESFSFIGHPKVDRDYNYFPQYDDNKDQQAQIEEGKYPGNQVNTQIEEGKYPGNQVNTQIEEGKCSGNQLPSNSEHVTSTVGQGEKILYIDVQTISPVYTVEENFISYALDLSDATSQIPWENFTSSPIRLVTLLRGLAPSILRVGGPLTDSYYFDRVEKNLAELKLKKKPVLTTDVLGELVELTRAVGARLLIGLGIQNRFLGNLWNPGDAHEILEFLKSRVTDESVDFELGNEPEMYERLGQQQLTPQQIAEDFLALNRLVRSYPEFSTSQIVGPGCFDIYKGNLGYDILEATAKKAGHVLGAITFHHYYTFKQQVTYQNLINHYFFSGLARTIKNAKSAVTSDQQKELPLWLGETSHTRNSGTPGVTDRFVSGFLWLEKLGLAARMGVGVVIRQTIYGGFDSLLNENVQPNPDYWLTLLYRQLVGPTVLNVAINGVAFTEERASERTAEPSTTRVYAHCTRVNNNNNNNLGITPSYPAGSVTLFALNVSPTYSSSLFLPTRWTKSIPSDMYLLTPPDGNILSSEVMVNGQIMKMEDDSTLPAVNAVLIQPGQPFVLPPLSFGFLVVPYAAEACY